MSLIVEVNSGSLDGWTQVIPPGELLFVGSGADQTIRLQDDEFLAEKHFVLTGVSADVALVSSRGASLFVNGRRIDSSLVGHCDWIQAGESSFRLWCEGQPALAEPETTLDRVVAFFQSQRDVHLLADSQGDGPLGAFLQDCLPWPRRSNRQRPGLAGEFSHRVSPVGPWPPMAKNILDAESLDYVIRRWWGKGRLVFFESGFSIESISDYFGSLDGNSVQRFFNPRCLRLVLQNGSDSVADWPIGPAARYWVESSRPHTLLECQVEKGSWHIKRHNFSSTRSDQLVCSAEVGVCLEQIADGPIDEVIGALLKAEYELAGDVADTLDGRTRSESVKNLYGMACRCGLLSRASRCTFVLIGLVKGEPFASSLASQLTIIDKEPEAVLDRFITAYNLTGKAQYVAL